MNMVSCLRMGRQTIDMMKHIYEIHTAAWLSRLSDTYKKPMTLGTVPVEEIDSWVAYGIDTIWLKGIWERSPLAAEINASDDQLKRNLTFTVARL